MAGASWDTTYLKSLVRGKFFFLYLVVDVWSRKILDWDVHDIESADLAAALIRASATRPALVWTCAAGYWNGPYPSPLASWSLRPYFGPYFSVAP